MKLWWCQVPTREKRLLLSLGILLLSLGLHVIWWDPFLQNIATLQVAIVQQDQDIDNLLHKINAKMDIEQQLIRIRTDMQSYVQDVLKDMDSQTFRKDIMQVANETGMFVRLWKLEGDLHNKEQSPQDLTIAVKVEGRFHQAVQFIRGIERLPWVRSITSIGIGRVSKTVGQSTTVMEIKIQGLKPADLEQARRLLAT